MGPRSSRPIRSPAYRRELSLGLPPPEAPSVEEQAAAVCYRVQNGRIEFLLVRTRKGRWTFPKGGVDPGLTPAEAARLEALEEAGVQGRIEETAFARYMLRKRGNPGGKPTGVTFAVRAHLCEVLRLGVPQEPYRSPAWFSARQAKRRLEEGRASHTAAELARVVERAVTRIEQLHAGGLASSLQ